MDIIGATPVLGENDTGLCINPRCSLTPIIKAVGRQCNLRCAYCFYHNTDQATPNVMSVEVLESFVRQYMDLYAGPVCFVWHGGEPLLAGMDFYRKAVALQREFAHEGQQIVNTIQTNATLITDDWADFIKHEGFRVGISLDGDCHAHDLFRRDRMGRGSFASVRNGIEVLRRHGIRFGVVQVLTLAGAEHIRETFRYFTEELGISNWSLNSFVDQDGYSDVAGQTVTNERMVETVKTCMELWRARDDDRLCIREIESYIAGALGKRSRYCSFNGGCRNYFCLDFDGGIYPCDSMTGDPGLRFGDLRTQPLADILASGSRASYLKSIERVDEECGRCRWYSVCHNGCPSERVGGVQGRLYYCQARRELFEYAAGLVSRHADRSVS